MKIVHCTISNDQLQPAGGRKLYQSQADSSISQPFVGLADQMRVSKFPAFPSRFSGIKRLLAFTLP